ncbi:MAG: hypothetical protein L6N96_01810 [Candidatus Methylarchaceae archaeon HK02M2]|nr:hypothetical protein [Candidatus Methylarchaceae archaeon HK01M]MCP8322900.1 hypothetical protein [Candidatus Methylarchaceae archaeon HK02M2]
MGFNKNVGTVIGVYSFFIGMTYTLIGLLEIVIGWGDFIGSGASLIPPIELAGINLIPPDVLGGIMLTIIGAVYLTGVRQQARGDREGLSFLLVGSLLAAVFFGVFTAIMLANGLGYVFQFEDWLKWTWLDDLKPEIWLFPLALPGAYLALTKKEWRE